MADGPVANLPAGLDAYAGYVDHGGIGVTWPAVQALAAAHHLSISVHGAPADCGDVENGALMSWKGFDVGYCSLSNVGNCIRNFGRPRKLWIAHYTDVPHICTQQLCDPTLHLTALAGWQADATQWTTHNNVWDESLLADDFFARAVIPPPPPPLEDSSMFVAVATGPASGPPQPVIQPNSYWLVYGGWRRYVIETPSDVAALVAHFGAAVPLTCPFLANIPPMP